MAKFRRDVNFLSFNSDKSSPATLTRPAVGRSRQPIKFIMVDLPDPEAPTIATNSPFSIRISTPSRALTMEDPSPNVFVTFNISTTVDIFSLEIRCYVGCLVAQQMDLQK